MGGGEQPAAPQRPIVLAGSGQELFSKAVSSTIGSSQELIAEMGVKGEDETSIMCCILRWVEYKRRGMGPICTAT